MRFLLVGLFAVAVPPLCAQQVCTVESPTATLSVPYRHGEAELNTDPNSDVWRAAGSAWIAKDCTHQIDYPQLKTEVRAFWTDTSVYFLFRCPYEVLNLWLPTQTDKPREKLWDRDVVEIFLGDDWENIRHYREFEVAPTGDWVDLAIDLDKKSYDLKTWRSGWTTQARIDDGGHLWFAAAKIPLKAVSEAEVKAGTKWRMNLYRIDGLGPDTERHFMCWQPTCVVNRDPNHVPEHFGTLVFTGE